MPTEAVPRYSSSCGDLHGAHRRKAAHSRDEDGMKIPMSSRTKWALSPPAWTTRLAAAFAVAAVLFAACDVHSPTAPGTLASITVTPNPTLAINTTQQFTAVGKDAEGALIAISPVWSVVAGGGAINKTRIFFARAPLGPLPPPRTGPTGGVIRGGSAVALPRSL